MRIGLRKLGVLLALIFLLLMGTGCALSGRLILFKEYSSSMSPNAVPSLQGVRVCVKPFTTTFRLGDPKPATQPTELTSFDYVKMTDAEEEYWDGEIDALTRGISKKEMLIIGSVRNGFGMVMSRVRAVNDPGEWLAECLKMDLYTCGAQIVEDNNADIVICGSIPYLWVDMYMQYWADLVVDVEMTLRGRQPIKRLIHTKGGQSAWSSSGFEFYQGFRMAQQKFTRLVAYELDRALRQ